MAQQGGQVGPQGNQPPAMSNRGTPPPQSSGTNTPFNSGSTPLAPQSGFSARDLIDPQSLPSWMAQQGGQVGPQGNQPPAMSNRGTPPPQSNATNAPFNSGSTSSAPQGGFSSGFSARDLIDPQSLPAWMAQQSGQGSPQSQTTPRDLPGAAFTGPGMPPPQPAAGQTFSASSLLDMNSLPAWMRESAQGQSGQNAQNSASAFYPTGGGNVGTVCTIFSQSSVSILNISWDWSRGKCCGVIVY